MSLGEARVLSYHDVLLREADVDILKGPHWLNDQLVAFYFTYLMEELHPDLRSSVTLVPAGASFLMLHSDPPDAEIIFEALQLHDKSLVVFAVNDNTDMEQAAGGFHWSCLAYHRPSNTFRHYDSSRPHNKRPARELAGAATPLVRNRDAASTGAAMLPSFVEVTAAPQQQNGYDCGLFVCAVANALCGLMPQQQQQQQQSGSIDGGALTSSSSTSTGPDFEQQERTALQGISSHSISELRQQMLTSIQEKAEAAMASKTDVEHA